MTTDIRSMETQIAALRIERDRIEKRIRELLAERNRRVQVLTRKNAIDTLAASRATV